MAIAPTPASGAVQQSGECTVYCCTTMYMYHRSTLSYQGPAVSSGPQKVSGPCRTALWARWSLLLPTGDPPRYRRVRRCVFCPHTQRGGAWALSEPAFRVSPPEDLTNLPHLLTLAPTPCHLLSIVAEDAGKAKLKPDCINAAVPPHERGRTVAKLAHSTALCRRRRAHTSPARERLPTANAAQRDAGSVQGRAQTAGLVGHRKGLHAAPCRRAIRNRHEAPAHARRQGISLAPAAAYKPSSRE